MKKLHSILLEKSPLYQSWHSHTLAAFLHWAVFIAVSLFCTQAIIAASHTYSIDWNGAVGSVSQTAAVVQYEQAKLDKKPIPTEILVKFKPGVSETRRAAIATEQKLKKKSKINKINIDVLVIDASDTVESALERIKGKYKADIEFAEANAFFEPSLTPNDPSYATQWHHPVIGSPYAWNVTQGSANVIIAILDSGIEATHPDLAPNIVPGWNFVENNSNTSDVCGHGTFVAGVAAQVGNNSINGAGVAFGSRIMPFRVTLPTSACYGELAAMASSLVYAADNGARVANISFEVGTIQTIITAAEYFQSKGGLVFVASGNNSIGSISSNSPYVQIVNATKNTDFITSWTNYGTPTDLSAPGEGVISTLMGGGVGSGTGTSFASPMVAGVAALVMSANPTLSATQVRDILFESADDLGTPGWDQYYGWGRVNAANAVQYALGNRTKDTTPPTAPSNLQAVAQWTTRVDVSWDAVSTDDRVVVGYVVYRDATPLAYIANTAGSARKTYSDYTVSSGAHAYAVAAYDDAHNISPLTPPIVLDTSQAPLDTAAPTIPTNPTATNFVENGTEQFVWFTWTLSTDNVAVMSYRVYRDDALIATHTNGTGPGVAGTTAYKDTTVLPSTSYTYTVQACDGAQNCSAMSVPVSITTPVLNDLTPPSVPTNLTAQAPDATRVNLAWTASTDNVGVTGYNILRGRVDNSVPSATIASTTATTYTDTNVTPGVSYWYQVDAYDAAGMVSQWSAKASVAVPQTPAPILPAITSVSVSPQTTSATITWTTNVVTKGVVNHGTRSNQLTAAVASNNFQTTHSVTLTGLKSNTNYYYNIIATDQNQSSVSSGVGSFKTLRK